MTRCECTTTYTSACVIGFSHQFQWITKIGETRSSVCEENYGWVERSQRSHTHKRVWIHLKIAENISPEIYPQTIYHRHKCAIQSFNQLASHFGALAKCSCQHNWQWLRVCFSLSLNPPKWNNANCLPTSNVTIFGTIGQTENESDNWKIK